MRSLLLTIGLVAIAGVAFAGDVPQSGVVVENTLPCNLASVCYDWDFAVSDHGFTTTTCDPTGGAPVWAYGAEASVPGAPGNVWATVLNGNYPNDSGEGLVSPPIVVGPDCYLMEVLHHVHIESNFDGANVTVNDTVIPPTDGYPATISTSTSFYAFCVDNEEGFTGNGFSGPSEDWVTRCFDLSAYMGQTIRATFDFGSDSSVTYPGWYLAYVKIGSDQAVPVESSTWGGIKDLYR
jgi:hypothetical protein